MALFLLVLIFKVVDMRAIAGLMACVPGRSYSLIQEGLVYE